MYRFHWRRWAALTWLLLGLAGCRPASTVSVISLAHLEPLPPAAVTGMSPLRVAVAAIISPRGTLDSYTLLLDYLEQQLGRPVTLVQRRTYTEVNTLLRDGAVDLAFVCTSAYVSGAREFGMQLLAAPQVDGEAVYHALLIVSADNSAQSLADLRGRVFAFTDPISTTGHNYPILLVKQLGEEAETFFGRTFYTYSHDDAIQAVANRVADAASVDSLVYAFAIQRNPSLGERVRVIHQSPAFAIPPVVVSPHVRPQQAAELRDILLHMADNADGRVALAAAGLSGFAAITDNAYNSVRDLEAATTP